MKVTMTEEFERLIQSEQKSMELVEDILDKERAKRGIYKQAPIDIGWIFEGGMYQKLSQSIRCF